MNLLAPLNALLAESRKQTTLLEAILDEQKTLNAAAAASAASRIPRPESTVSLPAPVTPKAAAAARK